MGQNELIIMTDEFGKGTVKNIIEPYYFVEFEDGIKRVVHRDKIKGEEKNE